MRATSCEVYSGGGACKSEGHADALSGRSPAFAGQTRHRLNGLLMRSAAARTGTRRFVFKRMKWTSAAVDAADEQGQIIGTFRPRQLRGGGTLRWRESEYTVQPTSLISEHYQLAIDGVEVATIEPRGWWGWGSRRPLKMRVAERVEADPGLLLFAAFAVRTLSSDAGATTAATSATTNAGAYSG